MLQKSIVGHESPPTGTYYTVLRYGYGPMTIRSSRPNISHTIAGTMFSEAYKRRNTNPNLQDERNNRGYKRLTQMDVD